MLQTPNLAIDQGTQTVTLRTFRMKPVGLWFGAFVPKIVPGSIPAFSRIRDPQLIVKEVASAAYYISRIQESEV